MKTNNVVKFAATPEANSLALQADALRALVDEYGTLCAQMAALKNRQAELKAQLITSGATPIEGSLFRITVSTCIAESLDMEAVRAKLSPQFIVAHTIKTERTTVRCTSRNGSARNARHSAA
jgi:hypothetical protein